MDSTRVISTIAGTGREGFGGDSGYLAAREEGNKHLVLPHTMSDAAANLMIAARDAVESYEGLRNNSHTSNTALAQSQVARTVTQRKPLVF